MGHLKNLTVTFLNKRNFYMIKTYSFYRKDLFGFLRVKRLYKYKKVIYSILKRKRRYYYMILNLVYKGLKFFTKRYKYKANLLFVKKRLKLFYGFFRDSYIGKLGALIKRKMGQLVNYFFSLIERRVDVLLYRSLYSFSVRYSRNFIYKKVVYVNNKQIKNVKHLIYFGDVVSISALPVGHSFFRYVREKSLDTFDKRFLFFFIIRDRFLQWFFFEKFKNLFLYFFDIYSKKIYRPTTPKHKSKRYKNDEKILKLLHRFSLRYFKYACYMLRSFKNRRKMYRKKRVIKFNKVMYIFVKKKIYHPKLIFEFTFILKSLIRFNKFFSKYSFIFKRKIRIYRLYGLVNLRIRLRKLFYLLEPRWFTRNKVKIYMLKRHKNARFKYYRYWKFSKFAYLYFKKLKRIFLIIKGYPSFLEVNYKIHTFLLVKFPTVDSVYYPFNFDKHMFYDYFKLKAYF